MEKLRALVSFRRANTALMGMLIVVCVGGCGTLDRTARNGPIPAGEGIVFGSISTRASQPVPFVTLSRKLRVMSATSSQIVLEQPISEVTQPFYWSLPAGKYVILDMGQAVHSFASGMQITGSQRIGATFSIDSEHAIVYVGTLHLESPSPFATDDYGTAVTEFRRRLPAISGEPTKQLLGFGEPK